MDHTAELLRSERARIVMLHTDARFVEDGILEAISHHVDQEWVLRIDDDEFPSAKLIDWADTEGCLSDNECWAISRLNLFDTDCGVRYSRLETQFHLGPDLIDSQFRLYRPSSVQYLKNIHSAGFSFGRFGHAPKSVVLIHCDLILRSADQRLAKLRQYEALAERSSWKFAYAYLPELFPEASHTSAPLSTSEFDALLNSLPRPQTSSPAILTRDERWLIAEAVREERLLLRARWKLARDKPPDADNLNG